MTLSFKWRTFIWFLCLSLPIHSLPAQNLQPTAEMALVQFLAVDLKQDTLKTPICFFGKKTKKIYTAEAKIGKVLLPNADTYIIYSRYAAEQYEITTTEKPKQTYAVAFSFDVSNQHKLYPTPLESLVKILLVDYQDKGIQVSLTFNHPVTKATYRGNTNAQGLLEILLPNDVTYTIDVGSAKNYSTIILPPIPYYRVQKEIQFEGLALGKLQPSKDSALFNLVYLDLSDNPVEGEIFTLRSLNTNKIYKTLPTDKAGKAQIKVPIGDTYSLDIKYLAGFAKQKVEAKPDLYVLSLSIQYQSSADWEKYLAYMREKDMKKEADWKKQEADMKRETEAYLQERAALKQRLEQEMAIEMAKYKAQYSKDSLQNARLRHKTDSLQNEAMRLKRLEAEALEKLWAEKGYTFGTDPTVTQVFKRNPQWKQKPIIMDVTGSMYPYTKQLEVWYQLQPLTPFVLFNDGDDKVDSKKVVGKTKGIYTCEACDVKALETLIYQASNAGSGGDSEENDVEAILKAQTLFPQATEFILIADNSPIRDYTLINQIKKPVRVVICGGLEDVNVEYLNLALQTGGSIHTLEQDLVDLIKISEGKEIILDGIRYFLLHGKFVRLSKL